MTPVDLCNNMVTAIASGQAVRVEHALRDMARADLAIGPQPQVNVVDLATAIVEGASRMPCAHCTVEHT